MNTIIKELLDGLEQVVKLHRESADDLERRIGEIKRIAEEGDYIILNAFVEKHRTDRLEYRRHMRHRHIDDFESDRLRRLYNETLIRAAACAEKDET